MLVQRASAYTAASAASLTPTSRQNPAALSRQNPATTPANSADTVSISQEALDLLASHTRSSAAAGKGVTAEFDTNQGSMSLDIDAYFTPPGSEGVDLDTMPLLMPSQKNIDALTRHISAKMSGFLSNNGIPTPPDSVTYDSAGKIRLPADYPYADAFRQALAKDPVMERELSTSAALTSQMIEMKKSLPFQQEYATASSKAEIDAIVAKYSDLFSDNQHVDTIALNFAVNGALTITHDGKSLADA